MFADGTYSVELVSPICQYKDIETVQELVRKLREAGAFVNSSCGIHIHINAAPFDAPHLRNLVNIMAAKEDMIYKALKVARGRESSYCRKIDPDFLERINQQKPITRDQFKRIWYNGGDGSHEHYHNSRYHSFYEKENRTVEVDGHSVDAFVYVMTEGHHLGMPSQYYVDVIAEGYRSAGFDLNI